MESKLADNIDNNIIAQNLGTNQIFLPKNSVPSIPNGAPNVNLPEVNAQAPVQTTLNQPTPASVPVISGNNYINLFGLELSKTTLYIILAFLALVAIYIYYTKSSKNDKKKSKKKSKKVKDNESSEESDE